MTFRVKRNTDLFGERWEILILGDVAIFVRLEESLVVICVFMVLADEHMFPEGSGLMTWMSANKIVLLSPITVLAIR